VGASGLEPPTPSLSSNRTNDASVSGKALTPPSSPVCTSVCTTEGENANAGKRGEATDQTDSLARLAAALLTLSPADRERLAAMLIGNAGSR